MANGLHAELRVPDLWYDFYARLIPGTAFVFALRWSTQDEWAITGGVELILLLLADFFCGLVINPISSRLTGILEGRIEQSKTGETHFIQKVQAEAGQDTRSAMILSNTNGGNF
jgi:hypothetical protein